MSVKRIAGLSLSLALLSGCAWMDSMRGEPAAAVTQPAAGGDKAVVVEASKMAVAKIGHSKNATTQPVDNNVTGTVTFTQVKDTVVIVIDLAGFKPGTTHGIHIHDKADLTAADLGSAGGHYDPAMTKTHGDPDHHDHTGIHAGDLGNILADTDGKVHVERSVTNLTIDGPTNPVVGHSVIIHAKADDLKTNPAGNSGPRIAGGVIEKGMK